MICFAAVAAATANVRRQRKAEDTADFRVEFRFFATPFKSGWFEYGTIKPLCFDFGWNTLTRLEKFVVERLKFEVYNLRSRLLVRIVRRDIVKTPLTQKIVPCPDSKV